MLRSADIEPHHAPEFLFNASLTKASAGAADPGAVMYTEGQKAFSQDDQLAYYSSGKVAVCVNERSNGKFITAYDDTPEHRCLLSFDPLGHGTACRSSGKPWLTVDDKGATLYRENGTIERQMLWECPPWHKGVEDPPSAVKPNFLRLSQRLALDFKRRYHSTLIFFCEGEFKYEVGGALRRENRYTEESEGVISVGSMRGKHVVKQESQFLQASNAVGERARAKFLVGGKVAGCEEIAKTNENLAHYLETTETMKVSCAPTPMEMNKAVRIMYPVAASGANPAAERLYAEAHLKAIKQSTKQEMHAMTCGRRPLPAISTKYYDEVISMCADANQLLCVCVFGSWIAESTRMERCCEELNANMWKVYENQKSNPNQKPPPCQGNPELDKGLNLPFRLVRYDPTKEKLLQSRHSVKKVPAFLFYYNSKLVAISKYWNTYGRTRRDLFLELEKQKQNGIRGVIVAQDYQML